MKKQNNQKNDFTAKISLCFMFAGLYIGFFFLDSFLFKFSLSAFITLIIYKALFPNNDTDKESK